MRIWIIFALLSPIFAQSLTILEAPNRAQTYTPIPKSPDRSLASELTLYMDDQGQTHYATNTIVVGFEKAVEIEAFAARYQLENPVKISRLFETWRFEVGSRGDPVAICAQIATQQSALRFAKPEWIATNRRAR